MTICNALIGQRLRKGIGFASKYGVVEKKRNTLALSSAFVVVSAQTLLIIIHSLKTVPSSNTIIDEYMEI